MIWETAPKVRMVDEMSSHSSIVGLSSQAAADRLKSDGYNELPAPDRRSPIRIMTEVVRQPMFALLLGGGLIYFLLGDQLEALFLLFFAGFSVVITIIQESRSERVLEALRNLSSPRALVIRDNTTVLIASRELVCDDIIVLSEGDRVGADANLLISNDLLIDESLLTGESIPVNKAVSPLNTSLAGALKRDTMRHVFAGTLALRGTGQARVCATGERSEMGKIGHALKAIKPESAHLKKQMNVLIRGFAIIGIIAGIVAVLLYGFLRGNWLEAMLSGIALGMSLLPEEFPLVIAVFMAMGAWRISRARVLTRQATAIEALGSITVLCTDKTGTLTENKMTVAALLGQTSAWHQTNPSAQTIDSSIELDTLLRVALGACPIESMDPMDSALTALVQSQHNPSQYQSNHRTIVQTYGLRPELLAVVNVVTDDDGIHHMAYAKGAIEAIVQLCRIPAQRLIAINQQADTLARAGIRVLGVAQATIVGVVMPQTKSSSPRDFSFEFMGLVGFADPLRSNVPAAVAECRSAGIRVVMITGDYAQTARSIAKQAGIEAEQVLTGDQIEAMSEQQLGAAVQTCSIFARIRPSQKLRIVQLLKANGQVVAMTGDGVNDAPALKAAHIGIAMGGRGTDVAREASAIVLLDDDFGSIVKTIRLGRRIYDNLRKAIEFIIAVHIPIAGLAILPLLLGLPLILTPILIAFLEMVIDPACSVVFEAEPEEEDVMHRPPREPNSPLLLSKRIVWAIVQGLVSLLTVSGVFIWASRTGMATQAINALVFALLVFINMGLILVNRSFKASLVSALTRPNRSLWVLFSAVVALLAMALYWQPAQSLFHFSRLFAADLALCAGISALCVLMLEVIKYTFFQQTRMAVASSVP
jgi:P-type Ca2+ transporter type 2C